MHGVSEGDPCQSCGGDSIAKGVLKPVAVAAWPEDGEAAGTGTETNMSMYNVETSTGASVASGIETSTGTSTKMYNIETSSGSCVGTGTGTDAGTGADANR